MYDGANFEILYQKTLEKVNRFLPFEIESLLTSIINEYCK